MFDVGDRDLPVLTSGNCVIKGYMTKWLRFNVFSVFFWKSKNMTFYVFRDVAHVFSNTGDCSWRRPHSVKRIKISKYIYIKKCRTGTSNAC